MSYLPLSVSSPQQSSLPQIQKSQADKIKQETNRDLVSQVATRWISSKPNSLPRFDRPRDDQNFSRPSRMNFPQIASRKDLTHLGPSSAKENKDPSFTSERMSLNERKINPDLTKPCAIRSKIRETGVQILGPHNPPVNFKPSSRTRVKSKPILEAAPSHSILGSPISAPPLKTFFPNTKETMKTSSSQFNPIDLLRGNFTG